MAIKEGLTLTGLLKEAAEKFPDRRAILVPGKIDLTHAQLHDLVESAAAAIAAAGVRPGDVVALTFPNTVEVTPCHRLFFFYWIQAYSLI